jgi:methionyl aminopeptidase
MSIVAGFRLPSSLVPSFVYPLVMSITTPAELDGMRRSGRVVAQALRIMQDAAVAGMTTAELDGIGAAFLRGEGARSAPQVAYNFPGFNLISVNDQIVHGVPGSRRLAAGDVVKLDVTAELDGYIADAAVTVVLAPATGVARRLKRCAEEAFECGRQVAKAGRPVREIGRAVEREVARQGFSVVRSLTGHGVGRRIHEPPTVPNYDDPTARTVLTEGMVLTIEPLITERPATVVEEPDGWTLRAHNGALAAHFEHTIVVTNEGGEILTRC